ncbi:MAG TPA: threonine synthase [Gemmatimonadales bacterium]|nr:threonine synthase [Gemmatimonadales bacterium]
MTYDWTLACSACDATASPEGLPTVCGACGAPWLVRYARPMPDMKVRAEMRRGQGMWRFRPFLPILPQEQPVTLGEGDTPLLPLERTGGRYGIPDLWLKDEGVNPTGSFKSRGMSAAVTRAVAAGARSFVTPTAGNAGVALAAYASRAGCEARVYAPRTTPRQLVRQAQLFGAHVELVDGHIGDCGKLAARWSHDTTAFNLSTLREPYRIEGKKTLGLELAMQFNWQLPGVIIYPTGGGTGLIGMWKAFRELIDIGWVTGTPPRMFTVQSTGCAPIVRAFETGAERAEPWQDPWTVASGLRVPGPIGDRLMLRALRDSGGGALALDDAELSSEADRISALEGVDLSPEGGAALAAARVLRERGAIGPEERVLVFNTGAGWLYRE